MKRVLVRLLWVSCVIVAVCFLSQSKVYAVESFDVRAYAANQIFFVSDCLAGGISGSASADSDFNPNDVFNENAVKVMTGLLKAGYSQAEAAGVIGSLKGESGAFNPGEGENKYMGDIRENDLRFRITDSHCYNRCGFGIAQWTSGGRQEGLQAYADSKNMSVASLEVQIEYLIKELKSPSYGFEPGSSKFKTDGRNDAEAAGQAAVEVCCYYETPSKYGPEAARPLCIERGSVGYGKDAFEFMENNRKNGSSSIASSDDDESNESSSSDTASSSNESGNVEKLGKNVTIIGDSITVRAQAAGSFDKELKNADIYKPQVGKHMVVDDSSAGGNSGKTLINELIENKKLREIVVVALGTNDSLTKKDVQGVVDLINSDGAHTIVFATNYGVSEHDYTSNNNVFKEIQKNNTNVTLANWAGTVSADPAKYMDDDVHPKSGVGTDLFASVIYGALTNGVSVSQERQYNEECPGDGDDGGDGNNGTNEDGVTFADYKGHTIAFPIAGATKDNISGGRGKGYIRLSNTPCDSSSGCHYGAGTDPAFDMCFDDGDRCKNDTPVVSITDGTITRDIQTTRNGAQCNHVRIKSDIDGTVIAYMHLRYEEDLPWHQGDKVAAGDLIGHVSDVGACHDNSTPHVHFDKGKDTSATGGPSGPSDRDPELVNMVNTAYKELPENEKELKERQSSGFNTNVSDDGLTYEQAKVFMMNYGNNNGNSSSNAMGSDLWGACNGGGSNCVSFSAFFYNKFTSNNRSFFGNGNEVVDNLKNDKKITTGKKPKVWSVFSWSNGGYGHTGIVLGHHNGKWIVGHASCSGTGVGKGDGTRSGGGSGFVVEDANIKAAVLGNGTSGLKYAYLSKIVNTSAISKYLKDGK